MENITRTPQEIIEQIEKLNDAQNPALGISPT